MKRINSILAAIASACFAILPLALLVGCASARNEVTLEKTTTTTETNGVVVVETVKQATKTDGHTLFDGKNVIGQLKAGQTVKGGQTIGITGQTQESTSEMIEAGGKALNGLVETAIRAGVKAVVPIPGK